MAYKPFLNPEKYVPATLVEPWRKVLLDAAQVIRERGHCKGHFSSKGQVCVIGAIRVATTGNPWRSNIQTELSLLRLKGVFNIADWNDAPERTAQDVISALEAAAQS